MKPVMRIAVVALALTPLVAIAQTDNGPLTRQQVKENLVRAERTGYRPSEHDAQYPGSFLDQREGIITSASIVYRAGRGRISRPTPKAI